MIIKLSKFGDNQMNIKRHKIIFYRIESIKVEFEVHFEYVTYKVKLDKKYLSDFDTLVLKLEK